MFELLTRAVRQDTHTHTITQTRRVYLIIIESKTNDFPQTIPFLVYAHSVSEHVHAKRMKKQKEGEWGVRGDYRHATSRRLE